MDPKQNADAWNFAGSRLAWTFWLNVWAELIASNTGISMYIRSISASNFKSFNERQELLFESGFNLILGGNNSGKSTVLEVLDLGVLNEPHRSVITVPRFGDAPRGESKLELTVSTTSLEMGRLFGAEPFRLPVQAETFNPKDLQVGFSEDMAMEFAISLTQTDRGVDVSSETPIRGLMRSSVGDLMVSVLVQPGEVGEFILKGAARVQMNNQVDNYLSQFRKRIYRFGASRRPGSQCALAASPILDPEAIYLPYCINHLQTSNAHGHRLLCEWVHRILPSVKWIQSTPMPNGQLVLHCLPTKPEDERQDLATPIARMGTGIGNIISILYVMLTSRDPQVIAIDEPNAFLHPRALRELLAILELEGKRHQYILTAHSADVLTSVNAVSINFVELDRGATTVSRVSRKDLHSIRSKLAELGISVTDLQGKDRVLWVEGQSEELIFPEILKFSCPEIAAGTAVLRVERTGTFDKRGVKPSEIASIYERLSQSSGLVPPMVCILLDAEKRKAEERTRVERESGGKLRFLERPMLENYLLEVNAIHATLESLGCICTVLDVEKRLGEFDFTDLDMLDGANVLSHVFTSVSGATQEFRKTRDVPALVNWIVENRPEHLASLRDYLRKIMDLPLAQA
jgi:hypothetical protein